MFDAVTAQILTPAGPGPQEQAAPVPAANAQRAGLAALAGLTALAGLGALAGLTAGERHVLGEWLDRVTAGGERS